ncbi:MAG: endonuclease NucS domain-containing protein [Weeksellaceae bacterium]
MIDKFLYLLEELHENYNENTFEELKDCYNNDLIKPMLLEQCERTKLALKNAPKEFYEFIAEDFINVLNSTPEMFLFYYEMFFEFFEEENLKYLLNLGLDKSWGDATDYINGILKLIEGSPEIALFHFNRIKTPFANYFISYCYQELDNYENAINYTENLLDYLNDFGIALFSDKNSLNEFDFSRLLFIKWTILKNLAFYYMAIKEYEYALDVFNISLSIINLEENYNIDSDKNIENGKFDSFLIFSNEYLKALDKNQKYKEGLEVLDFILSKYPKFRYFVKLKNTFKSKLDNSNFANDVITKIFKPRKPFNLGKFEETKILSKEKALEDMIIEQIKYGYKVFDKCLEVYNDKNIYGRQYYIPSVNGFLDLLLIDPKTDILYIVELKRNEAGTEVVSQIEKYMNGLRNQINKEIRGIICLHKSDEKLKSLINKKDNIELYTYSFDFNKIE